MRVLYISGPFSHLDLIHQVEVNILRASAVSRLDGTMCAGHRPPSTGNSSQCSTLSIGHGVSWRTESLRAPRRCRS